ncbi:MAG: hypothetical protein D3916_01385 [Candidatus Electrothrix sp. MAN1_4]|nr:hypothetical protein [Candidatus Electrothrix sp. MAN1_4]
MQKHNGHTTGKGILISLSSMAVMLYMVLAVLPVQAHNLWILGDADGKGTGQVHIYFEHHLGPGKGGYNGPIVERGKTWLKKMDGEKQSVEIKEVTVDEGTYIAGSAENVSGSYALDHTSLYGIYSGRLDFFHGRYIKADTKEDLEKFAESSDVPVQIIPSWTDKGLMLQIKYFALPCHRTSLWMMQPEEKDEKGEMKEKEMQANGKGEVLIGELKPGTYHFSTRIIENDPAGAFEYQAYKGLMHGSTLTLKLGSGF